MEDRWDCMSVMCIKEYKTLKVGSHYNIRGRGDLQFNADPEARGKTGYGLCVEDDQIAYGKNDDESYELHKQRERRDSRLNQLGI